MKGLKHIMKRFESVMSAAAFAEEGEFATARQIVKEETADNKRVSRQMRRDFAATMATPSAGRSK